MRIYPYYHKPENYPEFEKRQIKVTTRETLENTVQFMSLRDLPHEEDGTLLNIEEALDLYTKRFDLGKVFWMRAHSVCAPNLREFLTEIKKRNGYVFDLWGFVPGSYKKGLDWGEYTVTDEQHRVFTEVLGDRFIGYDNGEQDGRYIGTYARTACPSRQDNTFQQRHFYEFFDEMSSQLQHSTTALASLNYLHFFARENNCYILGAETAQALPNTNLWYSIIRGAGKQYGLLWFGNASVYNRSSWKSYDVENSKKKSFPYGPQFGTSLSLMRRLIYIEYLYNSDMLGFESGLITTKECMDRIEAGVPLDPDKNNSDVNLIIGENAVLSPIGRLQADCMKFIKERGYAGVMVTPIAVVLNSGNGWCTPRHLYTPDVYMSWGQMPFGEADHQLHALFSLIYPGYEDSGFFLNERGFLTPTPYGEQMDVIMTDMRPEMLRQYNVAILGGWQRIDSEQYDKFADFVCQGGILIGFAGQTGGSNIASLFGIKELGTAVSRQRVQVSYKGVDYAEKQLFVYDSCVLADDVNAIATLEDGTPFIIERTYGDGKAILVLSPYGMDGTKNEEPINNVKDVSIPIRYDMLNSVKAFIADVFTAQQLARVDNKKLETIVNIRSENTLTLTVVNNSYSTEYYNIELLCGRIISCKEIEIPDVDSNTVGYWPLGLRPDESACTEANGSNRIGPGQLTMWEIEFESENMTSAKEIEMTNLSRNVYISLRPHGILIDELQNMPMLDKYFAGIKLDASYVSDISLRQARQAGSWLKRRLLDVIVDFASVLDHYPHFSLIRNMPERQDAKLLWMEEILDKAEALGASRIVLTHHRNAENHMTEEEAAEHMHMTVEVLCEMAAKRGIETVMMNSVPYTVAARVSDLMAGYDKPVAINTCHCMLTGERPTLEQLSKAKGIMISAPVCDEFNQMIDAHAPVYNSALKDRITSMFMEADLNAYDFVCLDGVYGSFDEMYKERRFIERFIK